MTLLTDVAVERHPVLANRWSPRAFNPEVSIPDAALTSMLEAARWSPSAANSQPWRFVLARRGSEPYNAIAGNLSRGNHPWASNAAVLIVALAVVADDAGEPQRWAEYDLGQAVAHLTIQAQGQGYHAHQIGGFDRDGIQAQFELPESLEPVTIIALGELAAPESLPEMYRAREVAPRVRKELAEIVLVDA